MPLMARMTAIERLRYKFWSDVFILGAHKLYCVMCQMMLPMARVVSTPETLAVPMAQDSMS